MNVACTSPILCMSVSCPTAGAPYPFCQNSPSICYLVPKNNHVHMVDISATATSYAEYVFPQERSNTKYRCSLVFCGLGVKRPPKHAHVYLIFQTPSHVSLHAFDVFHSPLSPGSPARAAGLTSVDGRISPHSTVSCRVGRPATVRRWFSIPGGHHTQKSENVGNVRYEKTKCGVDKSGLNWKRKSGLPYAEQTEIFHHGTTM